MTINTTDLIPVRTQKAEKDMSHNMIEQLAILDSRIDSLVLRIGSLRSHGPKVETLEKTLEVWEESRRVIFKLFLQRGSA